MAITSGFGSSSPKWLLHIEHRPPLAAFEQKAFRALTEGEAAQVIAQTSNHWRKVFSIMAKISFALFETDCDTWQEYRDTKLLTNKGFEAISYDSVTLSQSNNQSQKRKLEPFAIVCGFGYASQQLELEGLYPHQTHSKLLLAPNVNVAVTPYFDWRQLNNELLDVVIALMQGRLSSD